MVPTPAAHMSVTCHIPQYILQDTPIEVVQPFPRGVDAHDRVELDGLTVDGLDVDRLRYHLVDLIDTDNLKRFLAGQTEGSS